MKRRASGVAIVGAAALPVGRLSPRDSSLPIGLEQDVLSLLVHRTLAETGIGAAEVGSLVLTLPPPSTRQLGLATMLAAHLGLRCTGRIAEVVEMGITGGLAFDQAAADIALGYCNFALALGVNLDGHISAAEAANNGIRAVGDVDFQSPFGITPISWYAFDAARYMYETGATRRDLAAVAVKNRRHAMHNPLAQLRGRPLSESEVLAQRPIVEPLGLLDVPPRGEGAVVLLLASTDAARELGRPYLEVRGRGFAHDGFHQVGDRPHDMTDFVAARDAVAQALAAAGMALADIQLAELYAPCTITEILVTEALGISERGRGGADAAQGVTAVGGRLPVNTSGGCLSRGHPPSLTGLYGLLEVREQLLGFAGERQVKSAQRALHCCELGNYNAALVHVLELAA
jgi:acetyl-CoA C-acetyltransferase